MSKVINVDFSKNKIKNKKSSDNSNNVISIETKSQRVGSEEYRKYVENNATKISDDEFLDFLEKYTCLDRNFMHRLWTPEELPGELYRLKLSKEMSAKYPEIEEKDLTSIMEQIPFENIESFIVKKLEERSYLKKISDSTSLKLREFFA